MSVAQYLTQQIQLSGKSQLLIASELGYTKPNIITMFKQGKTRLPLPKIVPMARALDVDPIHLLRIVMMEYAPETWTVLETVLGEESMLTDCELATIKLIRNASAGNDLGPKSSEEIKDFNFLVEKWKRQIPVSIEVD
jgi:hypothetical protein